MKIRQVVSISELAPKLQNLSNEVGKMRIATKPNLLSSILLMVSSLLLLYGCGKTLNGNSSGGCPDNVAPAGSTITGPANLAAPFVQSTSCYPALGFTVKDSAGNPMNGVCVEIYSDAFVALH